VLVQLKTVLKIIESNPFAYLNFDRGVRIVSNREA
jgi:hypothetical protein